MFIKRFIYIFFCISLFLSKTSFSADCKKPVMPSEIEWQSWLQNIKIEAETQGITLSTINNELSNLKPQSKIIMRDRCQPESLITLEEYLYYRVDKSRIYAGKNMLNKYKDLLNEISLHFKIQPRFIIAIMGMESSYGKNQGKVKTINAIATLAYDRRRSSFYKNQLFAALQIIDNNLVKSENFIGSWGGAVGMTQMIPTTFLESAYDWDGNGIDIWNSYADAFASIANYITKIDKNPWLFNSTWGREVLPPKNVSSFYNELKQINPKGCGAVKSRSIPKRLSEWQGLGFRTNEGKDLPIRNDLEARLIYPDGLDGKFYLVYPNYKNILYYNCSSYYAISVGLLSDKIIN